MQLEISRCEKMWFYGNFCDFKWFFVQPIYTKGFNVSIFLDKSFVFFIIRKSQKMTKSLVLSSLQRFVYHFKVCSVWFYVIFWVFMWPCENFWESMRFFENLCDLLPPFSRIFPQIFFWKFPHSTPNLWESFVKKIKIFRFQKIFIVLRKCFIYTTLVIYQSHLILHRNLSPSLNFRLTCKTISERRAINYFVKGYYLGNNS